MNKTGSSLHAAAHVESQLLLQSVFFCILLNRALALQPPATFTPDVAAGVVCQSYSPEEIHQLLNSVQEEYKCSLNNFGSELQRSIQRRFSDRLQIPYAKGVLIVNTPAGMDYWYCEESLSRDGARDLVEDFASQWRPQQDVKRPNYEVEVADLAPDSWSIAVNNLTWTPKLVETTEAEEKDTGRKMKTTWEAQKRPGRPIWFRYQDGWLWSSYSDNLLRADSLNLIPHLNASEGKNKGELFAQAWLSPDQVPERLRESFLSAMSTVAGAESQQRDGESAKQAHPRRVWNACREALVSAALNDVDHVGIQAWTSKDQLSLNAEIRSRQGSVLSSFLNQTLPGQIDSPPPRGQSRGIHFRLRTRIPELILSLFSFGESSEKSAPMDCVTYGIVTGASLEELYGHFDVQCRDPSRVFRGLSAVFPEIANGEIQHPLLNNVPIRLATTVNSGDSLLQVILSGPLSEPFPETDRPEIFTPHDAPNAPMRTAVCEIEADAMTLESLARHWLPEKVFSPDEQEQLEGRIDLRARLQTGRDGVAFDCQCTKRIARRVFAALTLAQ
jgi:hypothetical protein